MKMYFATIANGRSETKAVGDTFTESILMTSIYGSANATTVYCGTFCTYIAYHTSHTAANISLPTTTSETVFEEVSKSSTDQLCCSSSSLDGGYTDAEVGKLRDIGNVSNEARNGLNPGEKWQRRKKVSSRLVRRKST